MILKQLSKTNCICYQYHLYWVNVYYNHYQTLNLTPNATDQQIKQSFLKLAKLYHPDTINNYHSQSIKQSQQTSSIKQTQQTINNHQQPISAQQFIKIKQAYDILKQPNSRKIYDMQMFPQHINQQTQHFYFYRQAQWEQNHFRKKQQQKRKINLFINSLLLLTLTGFISHNFDLRALLKPSTTHQIRRQNIILANQNIDDGPITQQRRRQQYANEIKEKKIYGNVIQLKVRGATQQTTRARQKRLKGIGSIQGVQKQKIVNLTVYQNQQEYI